MIMKKQIYRRTALRTVAGSAVVLGTGAALAPALRAAEEPAPAKLKGHIHHSVSKWCYGKITLDDMCKACVQLGIESVEQLEAACQKQDRLPQTT